MVIKGINDCMECGVTGRGPAVGCGGEMLPGGKVLRVGVSGLT